MLTHIGKDKKRRKRDRERNRGKKSLFRFLNPAQLQLNKDINTYVEKPINYLV